MAGGEAPFGSLNPLDSRSFEATNSEDLELRSEPSSQAVIEPTPGAAPKAAAVSPRRAWSRVDATVAAVALLSALAVRLIHLDAAPYGGDERYVVLHALKFGTGDLNPRHFDWPASPFYYLTFLIDGCYFVSGYVFGWFRNPTAFVLEYLTNPRSYYLIPRALSAAFGLGTAVLLMKATTRMVDRPTGRLAGILLLLSPLHFQMSRAGLADVPMAFFVVATLYVALRIALSSEDSLRNYVLAGIMVGLATSMKYHGALSASFVISADLYREFPKSRWRAVQGLLIRPRLLAAGAASLLSFVATTPFAILDYRTFLADLSFQIAHQRGIVEHIGIVPASSPILDLIASILPAVVGAPILIMSVLGFVIVIVDRRRFGLAAAVLTPMLILNMSAFLMSRVKFTHYLLPAIPCLCALVAVSIRVLTERLAESEVRRNCLAALMLALILVAMIPAQFSYVTALGVPHTGTATMAWVLANCQPGMKLAIDDEEDLNFLPTTLSLDRSIAAANERGYSGRVDYYTNLKRLTERDEDHPQYDLYRLHISDSSVDYLQFLQNEGVRYFIRSESVHSMFRHNRPSPATEERLRFYRELETRGKHITTIEGDGEKLRGRAFQIFELPSRGR